MADLLGRSLGRYHILEQLGEGGMAIVYKAYDTRLERDVAVKIIRKGAFPADHIERILKRFEREAKALARLSHPNIMKIHDYGEHEGSPYLVMEYLPGGTLKQKMGKPMPWREAVQLLLPIAEALDYAHSQNMIHRDVKPANILLTQRGLPMLTDFGIAKVLDLEETLDLTGTNAAMGTPEYMAPEQATAKFVDHRADIYSLGVVLYEMVAGRKPFIADTPMAVLIKHATEALPRPSKFVSNLPDEVENILLKALAKQPENRYQDMGELVLAFEGALAGTVSVEKADRNTKERDAIESAEPERQEKELREKQVREARRETKKKEDKPVVVKPKAGGQIAYWFGGFIVLAFGIAFLSSLKNSSSSPQTTPENTQTQVIAALTRDNVQPSATAAPKSTSTPAVTLTPTPLPTEITDAKGVSMVLVPAGEFIMGGNDGAGDEKPVHTVFLNDFYIDMYEVSNVLYASCVKDKACKEPENPSTWNYYDYYHNPSFSDFPVVNVSWEEAKIFCEWNGARLPSEAEWEKAARGTDGNLYPWGNVFDKSKANLTSAPLSIDSLPDGMSIYGAYNMYGNVSEWVNDWYGEDYYLNSPVDNPAGPSSGSSRVLRGALWGWWRSSEVFAYSRVPTDSSIFYYIPYDQTRYFKYSGFRCAQDANP